MTLKSTFSDVIDFLRAKMDWAHENYEHEIEEKLYFTYAVLLQDFVDEAKRHEKEHNYDEEDY